MKTVYDDGEEVRFSCPEDAIYLKTQTKKCVSGHWVGKRTTCGFFIRNQIINVKVIDLTKNQTIIDINASNYTNDRYPVAFFDEKGTGLVVKEPHRPHQWWFQFFNSILFDFFLLNVRIPKSTAASKTAQNEIDYIRVKDIRIIGDYNRTCALDYTTRQRSQKIFWFWCTESTLQMLDNLTISFITYANHKMTSIGLHQVYITKLQYCGKPPIPLMTRYLHETGEVQCDPDTAIDLKVIGNSSDLVYDEDQEHTACVDNQYWAGNPKCLPKAYCKLDFDNSTEEIISVENAYSLSQTEWYAIEGTTVLFKCKSGHEMIGDSMRTCLHNSVWDQLGPICRQTKQLGPANTMTVITVTSSVSILFVILVILLVFLIIRKKKSLKNKSKSKQQNNENLYDDIIEPGNEDYAEYNYDKVPANYDYGYESPKYDNKYEVSPDRNVVADTYYLTLNDSKQYELKNEKPVFELV